MNLQVGGKQAFVATGGREFDSSLPSVVLIHGAGFDHTAWALHSRWFAHNGFSVLVPDLPGHGRSAGPARHSVAEMADWTAALLNAAGASKAHLIGHSMGSLIALEAAARHPEAVTAVGLIGAAAAIPVAPPLLAAAKANQHEAIDMICIWGYGFRAGLGGSLAPGLWMRGGAERLLERARPGVLFADLSACNDYGDGAGAAARVRAPATLVLGERDLMTPAKAGRELAKKMPNARVIMLKGAGHMLMSERPDEVLDAVRPLAPGVAPARSDRGLQRAT
jgi:pimeloyl-ACP methyl ester carboxylesterase